ncbi:hypothetical protein GT028_28255 [Streptomyces sp. SID2999]|nr:DUF6879 family protein [Streptomyces sp. SID2999]MYZ11225.1 hypothetical protein [Streptomyces sp. SID2999]
MSRTDSAFTDLLADTHHSAVHLEMRDSHGIGEEAAEFERWRSGWRPDPDPATWWNASHTWARDATARGVVFRRARIVYSLTGVETIRARRTLTPRSVAPVTMACQSAQRSAGSRSTPACQSVKAGSAFM